MPAVAASSGRRRGDAEVRSADPAVRPRGRAASVDRPLPQHHVRGRRRCVSAAARDGWEAPARRGRRWLGGVDGHEARGRGVGGGYR